LVGFCGFVFGPPDETAGLVIRPRASAAEEPCAALALGSGVACA
jgi:hypothetical protein